MLQPDSRQIARMLDLPLAGYRLPDHCSVQCAYRLFDALAMNEAQISNLGLPLADSGPHAGEFEEAEARQIYRAAETWLMAVRVFGDSEKARRFLTGHHPLLGGRIPIEVAVTSEADLQALRELLGRLDFGSAA